MSPDELESLEGNLDILSDPGAVDAIRAAKGEIDAGEGLSGEELRGPLPEALIAWEAVVAPSAEPILARLDEGVAAAVVGFMLGPLLQEATRVGKPQRRELTGTGRPVGVPLVVYGLDHDRHQVRALRIEHRTDVYRPG